MVFQKNEIVIGRGRDNDVVLQRGNISRRHARIVRKDNRLILVDLKSSHGTYVNGHQIRSPQIITHRDQVSIGDFTLQCFRDRTEEGPLPVEAPPLPPGPRERPPTPEASMPYDERISLLDWNLSQSIGQAVWVGKAFAFIGKDAFTKPGLSWLGNLLGSAKARPRVISLLGPAPVELPGVRVSPLALPSLRLAVVTSDKALYREGKDEVHLLVVDPLSPGNDATLEVRVNGAELARHTLTLGAHGAQSLSLRDLSAGEYEVRFVGAPTDEPACTFTVAAYRLAPLVASLLDRRVEGEHLKVRVRAETFGVPVEGEIRLEMLDRGQRIGEARVEARGGVAEATLPLTGEGPHSINLQLVQDPSRTATLPIVGSRASERSRTIFSTLGAEVSGSLLPSEGSRLVRGIFLEEGAVRTTPFRLDQVDTNRARLFANSAAESVVVVVLDPSFPQKRPDAQDPQTATHPYEQDRLYQLAEKFFQEGKVAEARAVFEEGRAALANPHPYYAYYIACCYARQGEKERAVFWLRTAISDGWVDFAHMANDDDLASLRGFAPYETLKTGGRRELTFEDLAAGSTVEIEIPEPMAILAVGAYVGGSPWEGWAAVLTPDGLAPQIFVPPTVAPSEEVTIEVDTGCPDMEAAVYLIVKDARLLSQDTPQSRLAGQLKNVAEEAGKKLAVGRPQHTLSAFTPPPPPAPPTYYPPPARGGVFYPPPAPFPSAPMPVMSAAPGAPPEGALPPPVAATPRMAPMAPQARSSFTAEQYELPEEEFDTGASFAAEPEASDASPEAPPRPTLVEEPEVLFAGLLPVTDGRAQATVNLGDAFADYLVEAFVISGRSWSSCEKRFRAEKDPFVSLETPLYLHPEDTALGRLIVGSSGPLKVRLTCDGAEVKLVHNGNPLSANELLPGRTELVFLAGPGEYEATVENTESGARDQVRKRVEPPGKLTRLARALRFLQPGEKISRQEDPKILALRVLPGLEKPFRALVNATADYSYACCEQTAAKLLAGCAMYLFAENNPARRDLAEAVILAGIRRERLMWLKGRGFKMYPDSANTPHEYYGTKAARYLWNLDLLRTTPNKSAALTQAIEEGLMMARDATEAYRLAWPPKQPSSCEEAYMTLRFSTDNAARERAIALIRQRVQNDTVTAPPNPYMGGAVLGRTEAAYAAAALLRLGPQERALALRLTNTVVKQFGDHGRLYSTVDSVAAIALMSELIAAQVVGGAGRVEVNGQVLSTAEATAFPHEIEEIAAKDHVTAVEISRLVEEDWTAFASQVPLLVSLEKNGRPTRKISVGDAIELRVKLEEGYKTGDILWVCLPDALSRVVGGGQVKRFAVDFEGKDEVRIPLAATSITVNHSGAEGRQHFAVCVRNMFEEERAGNPGLLNITVSPTGSSPSFLDRLLGNFRVLFQRKN